MTSTSALPTGHGLTIQLTAPWPGLYLATWHWRTEPAGRGMLVDVRTCARTRWSVADAAVCAPCGTAAEAAETGEELLHRYAGIQVAVVSIEPAGPTECADAEVWLGSRDAAAIVLPRRPTVSMPLWAAAGYASVIAGRPLGRLAGTIITAQPAGSSSKRPWSWPA